jgi:hypothetical protein
VPRPHRSFYAGHGVLTVAGGDSLGEVQRDGGRRRRVVDEVAPAEVVSDPTGPVILATVYLGVARATDKLLPSTCAFEDVVVGPAIEDLRVDVVIGVPASAQ